eukprot:NODE_11_length_54881_cov_1.430718.p8 type:complete len:564 gc:universal NODE_11_length_54881_cov_1.430718:15659-17350(+)
MSSEVPVFLHSKKVKDIPFCVLFLLMIVAQFVVLFFAAKDGNLTYLTKPYDSNNNLCGVDNGPINGPDYSNRPFLYFIDPVKAASGKSKTVCLTECPTEKTVEFSKSICVDGVKPDNPISWQTQIDAGNCTSIVFDSKVVLNRCIPKDAKSVTTGVLDKSALYSSGTSSAQVIFADVTSTYPYILIAMAFSVVIAFVYLILLNYVTAIMTWISIILGQLILAAMTVYSYFEYASRVELDKTETSDQNSWEIKITLSALIILGFFTVLYFFVLIILRKRINVAVEIIKESSQALRQMKSLFILPIATGICQCIAIGYFFVVAALLLSVDRVPGSKILGDKNIYQYLQWYNLFGLLWGVSFIYGVHQTTIAGSVAAWYWSLNKKNIPKNPTIISFLNVIKYSLGSIALGSFILAFVRFLRLVLVYLQRTSKSKNSMVKKVFSCLQCCLGCIEKLIKFMNKNSYVVIGIYGTSFCKSAQTAFGLLSRNALRLIAIESVSGFVIFIGKMFISLLSTGLGYFLIRYLDKIGTIIVTFPLVSAAIILVSTYVLSGIFFDVVDMAIGKTY